MKDESRTSPHATFTVPFVAIVLVIARFPEAFDKLPRAANEQVFGFEMGLHDDEAPDGHVYAYVLGHQSRTGVFHPGRRGHRGWSDPAHNA